MVFVCVGGKFVILNLYRTITWCDLFTQVWKLWYVIKTLVHDSARNTTSDVVPILPCSRLGTKLHFMLQQKVKGVCPAVLEEQECGSAVLQRAFQRHTWILFASSGSLTYKWAQVMKREDSNKNKAQASSSVKPRMFFCFRLQPNCSQWAD